MRFTVLIAAIVELAILGFLVAARDDGWESEWASGIQSDPSMLQVQREVRSGGMPPGARNPQLGRISGGETASLAYGKSEPHIGGGKTPYQKCPPHLWSLYLLRNVGFCGKPAFGKTERLFAAPPYKKIGAFTVADVDSDGSSEIVAALGNIDRDSKKKWAADYRFFVRSQTE